MVDTYSIMVDQKLYIEKIDTEDIQDYIDDIDILDQSPSSSESLSLTSDMTFVYVVSNSIYTEKNLYKIGKHKGSKKMLIKRYKTYLIEPIVHLFFPTGNAGQDECAILGRFSKYRMGTSEFVQLPLEKILDGIHQYYKYKYLRNVSVHIPYHRCIYKSHIIDFIEKTIHMSFKSTTSDVSPSIGSSSTGLQGHTLSKKCLFFPYLSFENPDNCLKRIEFKLNNEKIFDLFIEDVEVFMEHTLGNNQASNISIQDFIKCFILEFMRRDSVLYLDKFIPNGWNDLIIQMMKEMYGYSCYKEMNRRDFLQKEKFPERVILIKKSGESDLPLEMIMEKAQFTECCFVIEDKNFYSIENYDILSYVSFEKIFYYLFYVL